ncbi:hypothetical protein B7P02_15565 [Bordetella bronchiseptica]|uniref:helix-turn-helix domain-containing protein n=1 Tax=Bordetella bronchiseptica TaxID=518 RepID=UPI000D736ABB|nr:helix-turn-helix transcriptional regulator [Bordetella bronchiseptica]AWP59345.1 hypothetical protein B7P02_15565 [Bordetella bronchiseptica]
MNYSLENFSDRLREARIAKNLSQRELSKLAGVPQSHISKIESNQVDLRLSSLIAIANALDLEVTLVPRQAMPAVQSMARQAAAATASRSPASLEEVRQLGDKLRELQVKLPARPELDALRKAFAGLKPLNLDHSALARLRQINQALEENTGRWGEITDAAKKITTLRNQIVHAPSQQESPLAPKPAYSLDDEDDQ